MADTKHAPHGGYSPDMDARAHEATYNGFIQFAEISTAVVICFVLALAGSLARQGKTPESVGTLPTHRPQFVGMVSGVTLILVALTFLPMLALGPLAEGIH